MNAVLLGVIAVAVTSASAEEPRDLRSPELTGRGQALFSETYTYCHGEEAAGGGGSGAPGFRGHTDLGAQDVFNTISNSCMPGTNIMPARKDALSEEERWALASYVLSLAGLPRDPK